MKTRALALLLAAASAFAADREFDRLTAAVESRFGVRRQRIPLMGVANFFVKVARPEGARGFKLAIFEDLRLRPEDGAALDRMMAEAAAGLHLLVRVRSNQEGERTYVYVGGGKNTTMLIATFERDEATVVEVKVDAKSLARVLADPSNAGRSYSKTASNDRDDRDY
jgi:hypothetical protein